MTQLHPASAPVFLHYASTSIPFFIALQNCLNSISNQKPIKQVKNQIFSLVQRIGPEGQKLAILTLMESLQLQTKDKTTIAYKSSLLIQLIKQYAAFDNFFSYFPEIITKVCKENKLTQLINNLINNLKFTPNIQIAIALSLYLSDRSQLISIGQIQLINKIKQYVNSQKPTVKLNQKLLEELLFQINISPQLSVKLENQSKFLLDAMEKINKSSNESTRIYNYFRQEWQYFANQTPIIQKIQPIVLKKSDILKDLGPTVTQQIDTLRAVILQIGPLNQEDIFECLMMMAEEKTKFDSSLDRFIIDLMSANSATNNKKNIKGEQFKKVFNVENVNKKNTVSWNIDNFLQYAAQNVQNIKWQNVLSNLDRQNLTFVSQQHFVQIMKVFDKIKKLIKKWSIADSILLKKWNYPQSQAQFLVRLFACKDAQCLFFNQSPSNKKGSNVTKQIGTNPLRQIWGFLQFLTLLFEVSEYNKTQQIIEVLNTAAVKYPDILIKSLSQIKPEKGQEIIDSIYFKILPQFLQNDVKSIKLIQTLWKNNKQLLIQALNSLQSNQNKKKTGRNILDYQKIVEIFKFIQGSLQQIIEESDYKLAFPLAFIGVKRQCINLEKWLTVKLSKNQSKFCKQFLTYLQQNLLKQLRQTNEPQQKQNILQQAELSIETLNKILTIIIQKLKQDYPNSKNNEIFKKLHKDCCKLIPELAQGQIYQQAQRECQQQIKKIYKQQISIKDAVENLKKLKNSNKKQQRQHFANRITFLCIQLTYHHSYPEKQLMITADLFSALINANLVEKKIYQTFLHVIDQYLKQENQQFTFAMKVIENIKQKLAHQSWFCQKLIDNEIVMRVNPQLVQSIFKSIQPPKVLSVDKQRKIKQAIRLKNTHQIFSRHIIIEPEVHHHIEVPQKPQNIQYDILATLDKTKKIQIPDREAKLRQINTIFNTLSMPNVQQKAKQLKKTFDNQKTIKLLAYSLVFKRITIAQNNGIEVFVKLIESIPRAQKPVVSATYKILQHWFNLTGKSPINDKKFTNFKNIGAWLGRMTIGKGYPIPIYKLNIKQILAKSFQTGSRLNFTIPTILKILQFTPIHPEIFHTQSPWLRRIFCILNQISLNLKQQQQQLKSQIKAFFRSSKIDIQSILLNQPSILNSDKEISINQLIQKLNIGEQFIKFCQSIEIRNVKILVVKVLDVSITDIVEPVIDRTVKIAIKTTRCMVTKDFATESNVERVHQSSVNLVKQLASPLAQITCRQPLKAAITKNLRDYLRQHSTQITAKQQQIQMFIQRVLQQTLDIGCGIIKQKAAKAAEKAIKEDPAIIDGIQRRNYIKKQGQLFYDQAYISQIPAIVPLQLRNDRLGLSQQQFGIYTELKKIKRKQPNPKILQKQQQEATLIQMLQQKQPIQSFKKLLPDHIPLHQQFIQKIHTMLLDQQNTQQQIIYYLQICQQLKQYCDQNHCWKLFKQVSDLKSNQAHQRIVQKLVRQKYFQESVLTQILETYITVCALFDKWVFSNTQQEIANYIKYFQNFLGEFGLSVPLFFYYGLKYVMTKLVEQSCQNTQCYNPQYPQSFANLLISYYCASKTMNSVSLSIILQTIVISWQKFQQKHSTINTQRFFTKIIVSSLQYLHSPSTIQQNTNQKITTYVCMLAKTLQKINPLIKPNFAFTWLQLICNKYIIKNLLDNYQYWDIYFRLLCNLLKFMNQNVTENKLYNQKYGQIYQTYYKAVMKLIVILMHDYLKFVSEFSLQLCVAVDGRFVQLKNIIISAYPLKQLDIPLKFQKRQDFQQYVQKIGYPKYYKLNFDKPRLNYYVHADVNDVNFKEKILQQDDLFLQTLILYLGWSQENNLTLAESTKKLTAIISSSKDQLRLKLINYIINLIRYPNYITLFFIDFVTHILLKQKDNSIRELMLANIITRMAVQVPIAWGMIYLMNNVLLKKENKDQMRNLGVSNELLEQF